MMMSMKNAYLVLFLSFVSILFCSSRVQAAGIIIGSENDFPASYEGDISFLVEESIVFSPVTKPDWKGLSYLVRGGNLSFASYDERAPQTIVVKNGECPAFFVDGLKFASLHHLGFLDNSDGSIIAQNGLSITDNAEVEFDNNTYGKGGAVCVNSRQSMTDISYNGEVSFSGNQSAGTSGGAIFAGGYLTLSHNRSVHFSRNGYVPGSFGAGDSEGGAIYSNMEQVVSNNAVLTFSENFAVRGGAVYNHDRLNISDNADAAFVGNIASDAGGAIYAWGELAVKGNAKVLFEGNEAAGSGGAIYGRVDLDISNNDTVSFSDNRAASRGGAIYIDAHSELTLNNNAQLIFCGNGVTADESGAIHSGSVYIQGNDYVLFEKNYTKTDSAYRLRSIYQAGSLSLGSTISLSAKNGGQIMICDSVYSRTGGVLNADYTDKDGNTQKAGGDIVFSGQYAEQHLNEILAKNGENRTATAEEISHSQTSQFEQSVSLRGGRLRIEEGAKLKASRLTLEADSHATLNIRNAELHVSQSVSVLGSNFLELSAGAQIYAADVAIYKDAALCVTSTQYAGSFHGISEHVSELNSDSPTYTLNTEIGATISGNLTIKGGATYQMAGAHIALNNGVLYFNISGDEKVRLLLAGTETILNDSQVILFSGVKGISNYRSDIAASAYFTGDCINEHTMLHFDNVSGTVYLQGLTPNIPETSSTFLCLVALAALSTRRRRD